TLGERHVADRFGATERDAVQELERRVHLAVAGIGQLLDFDLVQQKGADLRGTEFLRRTHEEGGKLAAVQQVIAASGYAATAWRIACKLACGTALGSNVQPGAIRIGRSPA